MSDMINRRQDGRDDFVAAFTAGWHGKGQVEQRVLTIEEALEILDPGQVVKVPVYGDVTGPDGLPFSIPMPGQAMTVRIRNQGATIVFVEHVMHAVMALTDRIVVFDQGRLLAPGHADAVMRQPEVMVAYLGRAHA